MAIGKENLRSGLPLARVGGDVIKASEDLECWVSFDTVCLT